MPRHNLLHHIKQHFSLRPLFFAYEDRENIAHLIVDTYECLVLTLSVDEEVVTPRKLWLKTTAIMNDSISKSIGWSNNRRWGS